ncbi:MAG: hypothetical protein HUU08_11145 [Candidatus Brocadia sp.]|nr:hypothetical protein [Candidatus Brocadia sp.]
MFYESIFDKLNKSHIDYIVVGGVALVLHGVVRLTADLDLIIVVRRSQKKVSIHDDCLYIQAHGNNARTIIFDLDDTLYDCSGTLVLQGRKHAAKMIAGLINCSEDEAYYLQLEMEDIIKHISKSAINTLSLIILLNNLKIFLEL